MSRTQSIETEAALSGVELRGLAVVPPLAVPSEQAGAARERMRGERHGTVSHVVLCDGRRFVGMVRATDLVAASAMTPVRELAIDDPPVVTATATRHAATWAAVRRGESEVAVIEDDGTLVGLVPAPRLLAVCFREHEDDLATLSGFLQQGASARRATDETVLLRLWHRLPWLLVGLAGAAGASVLVSSFERDLQRMVALSFFVPGIVYLADAVGTQTEAIIVRGLSLGVRVRDVVWRELVTGVVLGLCMAIAFLPAARALGGSWPVAWAVSLALFAACALANIVALLMPWLLDRLRADPAYGAGPLATVVQDLLSIAIYFAIARAIAL